MTGARLSTLRRRDAFAVTAAVVAVLLSSCTRVVDDARAVAPKGVEPYSAQGAAACKSVDVDLVDVPAPASATRNDGPVLRIPKPAGWDRITSLDSDMIRYVMRSDTLAADGIAPTAVVTLESHRGKIAPKTFFAEQERQVSQLGVTDLNFTDTTLCGLPAVRGSYMSPLMGTAKPRQAELLSAVMFEGGMTWGVAVTLQSADSQDPAYIRDSEAILDGFQMLPPGPG